MNTLRSPFCKTLLRATPVLLLHKTNNISTIQTNNKIPNNQLPSVSQSTQDLLHLTLFNMINSIVSVTECEQEIPTDSIASGTGSPPEYNIDPNTPKKSGTETAFLYSLLVGAIQIIFIQPLETFSARNFKEIETSKKTMFQGAGASLINKALKPIISLTGFGYFYDQGFSAPQSAVLGKLIDTALNPLNVIKFDKETTSDSYFKLMTSSNIYRTLFGAIDGTIARNSFTAGVGTKLFTMVRNPADSRPVLIAKSLASYSVGGFLSIPIEGARQRALDKNSPYFFAYQAFPSVMKDPSKLLKLTLYGVKSGIMGGVIGYGVHKVLKAHNL